MAHLSFEDAVRIISTAQPEFPGGADLDASLTDNPALRIDAWSALITHSGSSAPNKYARKMVAVLGRTLSVGVVSTLAHPDAAAEAELMAHLKKWLWAVTAVLVTATTTTPGAAEGIFVGLGAAMFGRVDEVLLLVAPALRLYASAAPAVLAALRSGGGEGCPLLGLAVVCSGLLLRYAALPSAQRKVFDACFSSAERLGESSLVAALCGARAAAVNDLARIPGADADSLSGGAAAARQAARLAELTEDALAQVPFECGGALYDVSDAFVASALLVAAATGATSSQPSLAAAARDTPAPAVPLVELLRGDGATGAPAIVRSLEEWAPPPGRTRERAVFETLFAVVNGGAAVAASAAALSALPLLLERFIRLRRDSEEGAVRGGRAAARRPDAATRAAAPAPAAAAATGAPASSLATLALSTVSGAPEFGVLCECLVIALGAAAGDRVARPGGPQGAVSAGAPLVFAPLSASGAGVPVTLRLRAAASLLAVALRHGLYSAHEDVAPHPQLAVLHVVAHAALCAVEAAAGPDRALAALGALEVLLQLDHRVVQPLVERALCAAVAAAAGGGQAAATVLAAAASFAASLCGVYARLRALPLLLDTHWAAADRVLGAADGAEAGAAAFLAVFSAPVHAQAFEAAVAGLSGGQLPEVGAHLQRQLGATAARVQEAAAAAGAALQPPAPPPGASSKKRRREAAAAGGGGDGSGRSAAALAHFTVLASHAAAFLRHARLTPANAVAVMGAALGLGEAGAAPILALYDDDAARASMPAVALDTAVAAALQLASACSAVALSCAAHEGLRALVPSVIAAAAAAAAAAAPPGPAPADGGNGQGAVGLLWPATAFSGLLPSTAEEGLVGAVAPRSGAALPRPDLRRLCAWWGALASGGSGPLGAALAAFAAGRLRALHAVVASERRGPGGAPPASPSAAAARLLSDLLLSRGPPGVASGVLDVCAVHAAPERVADFAGRLFAVPPAPWQLALWRDAQLYELAPVVALLPAALEREARSAADRICGACETAPAAAAKQAGASAKKPPRAASRSAAVSAALSAILAAPGASDAQRSALSSVVALVEQPPAPASSASNEALGGAVSHAAELLSFLAGLPDAAFGEASGATESLAAIVLALHAAVAALGGPAALPHPGLLRLPWGDLGAPGACVVASQVRFSRACALGAQADAPEKLGAAIAAAFRGEWADGELSANAAATAGEAAATPKKKRKALEASRVGERVDAAAEAVAARLLSMLTAQLDACGVNGDARGEWVWLTLQAVTQHASRLLAGDAASTARRIAAASIALVAERPLEASAAVPADLALTAGRLRLAAGLADLAGESEAAPLEGAVLRCRVAATAALQAWLAAARGSGLGGGGVLSCLAGLLGRLSPSSAAEAALGALPRGSPGPGELWAASLVSPVLLERLLLRPPAGTAAAEGGQADEDARVTLLMAAALVDVAPLAARAVLALVPASPFDDRRSAVAFVSACISAASLGYYRRGGSSPAAGSSSEVGGGELPAAAAARLGDGSKGARDFISAVAAAALPGAVALAAALGREPLQPSLCPGVAGGSGDAGELVTLLEMLRLALSHPHVVFLGREHVKLCLEALSPLCAAADALLLRGPPGGGSDWTPEAGLAAPDGPTGGALEDVDAGCRTEAEAPLLVEAGPAAAAVCAALRRGLSLPAAGGDERAAASDTTLLAASAAAAAGSSAALATALGVVRAALTYHGAAALSFWPVASQLLQAAFVLATTRGAAAPPASNPADGFASDAALAAVARVCEDASRALAVARFHAVPLVARLLIQWAHRSPPLPARVRERLLPGLHALLDVCRPGELQALHTGLGRAGLGVVRAQLRELHTAFAAHVKYRGKL